MTDRNLENRILSCLRPCVGQSLRHVTYWCLRDEARPDDLQDPRFYLGGEVELRFENELLIVTWDENAGWKDHFSVQCRTSSAFNTGALESLDASALPIWSDVIDTKLTAVTVLGWNGTPAVLQFEFPRASVLLGVGYRGELRDGDDVTVRTIDDAEFPSRPECLWRSPAS